MTDLQVDIQKALARSMAQTKQIKAAAILNNAFSTSSAIGDGAALASASHPTINGNQSNILSVASDLNETSLEQALIDIAGFKDERGLKIAVRGMKLIIPKELQFTAERVLNSNLRVGTSDNDANAIKNMGMLPEGAVVNHFLTDTDAFFIKTDAPNGFKYFNRSPIKTAMEGDFDTGNMRFKAREIQLWCFRLEMYICNSGGINNFAFCIKRGQCLLSSFFLCILKLP